MGGILAPIISGMIDFNCVRLCKTRMVDWSFKPIQSLPLVVCRKTTQLDELAHVKGVVEDKGVIRVVLKHI